MEPVAVQKILDPDAVPSSEKSRALSGVGTGGGKAERDAVHFLKDAGIGGALPDTQETLDAAVEAKHYRNEKAMEGTLTLVRGFPRLRAGDKIALAGLGPIFSGEWVIETHTLKVSEEGCHSSLELTRNALGDAGTDTTDVEPTIEGQTPKKEIKALKPGGFEVP